MSLKPKFDPFPTSNVFNEGDASLDDDYRDGIHQSIRKISQKIDISLGKYLNLSRHRVCLNTRFYFIFIDFFWNVKLECVVRRLQLMLGSYRFVYANFTLNCKR
jgi:hypothetical protein